jgi:Tol biopolymer transport system component
MDADGDNEINLTPNTDDSDEFAPTVNKAGDRIAFSIEDSSGNYDIYVGTFTGTALNDLKNLTADVDNECWRPRYAMDFKELPN